MSDTRTDDKPVERHAAGTPYGIFLAVMTVFSLITTGILLFDWAAPFVAHAPVQMVVILEWVDLFFCGLFLLDWIYSVTTAKSKLRYLFGERPGRSLPYGVLELFGTIPVNFFFRLLRLFRLRRMGWHASDLTPRALYRAVVASRTQSAVLITVIVVFLVIVLGSISVLYYEFDHPLATIDTANDAFWWAIVTITSVGYGDQVPITNGGRAVAVVTMIVGIGIFGVVAGSLAGLFTSGRKGDQRATSGIDEGAIAVELAALRAEIADLRRSLTAESGVGTGSDSAQD